MKKWTALLSVVTLSLGLAACNETATPVQEKEVTETSKLTLQEVYDKSLKTSEELKSVKGTIDMKQTMNIPSAEMTLDIKSLLEMEYIIEPMKMHQKGTTTMMGVSEGGESQETDMETYITEDAMYVYEGTTAQWMKFPQEMVDQMLSTTKQTDPSAQLQPLQEYLEQVEFEQDNENYILTLEGSGEEFTSLVQDQVDKALQSLTTEENVNLDVTIHSVNYLVHIDKQSFQTNKLDMIIDMDMKMDGETVNMKMDAKTDFSKFNEIDEIVVPQEVIDSATEL
ncbi:hypothetical protein KD050_08605 [Psychrobacillus sp. INOP01]|uniref:DUF6612 family protein n=1 Tax=Psychrobacillus sp. INOP01 TaxID=2829187 RepID=UPI001BA8D230|nr:DUF6612 family protein [Psychrobacillus sp. INOP01]QUG43262.1 hypothetical protein KD050_08605 [Psychrobacillus sp. INOP01]